MKKIAVIASGWHFPIHFFEQIAKQKMPNGWQMDMFVVSHRDPSYAIQEKKEILEKLGYSRRELYDRIMYREIATVDKIEKLGWKYVLEPNTMGNFGNTNQWLSKNDYKTYDKFLITHDDNFILSDKMFLDVLPQDDWLIMSNSTGNAQRRLRQWLGLPKPFSIRASFEFFTKEMFDKIGGTFDMSQTTLTREGKFTSSLDMKELGDWNNDDKPLSDFIIKNNLLPKIKTLSSYYRVSKYCIEGERGFIFKTEKSNTKEEEKGLDIVEKIYKIKT